MKESSTRLLDPARLRAVEVVLSQTSEPDDDFDRIARLASKALNAPTSFVTLITATQQNFRGLCGAPDAMGDSRGSTHESSLCLHTVLKGEVVAITNTGEDEMFKANPIVQALGLKAYLGIPLVTSSGHILGSICVIDYRPRSWSVEDVDSLRDHAAVAVSYFESVAKSAKILAAFDVALHDLKTPLSGLLIASSLVSERMNSLPAELHPILKVVEESTAAAIRLVDTLTAEQRNETSPGFCNALLAAQNAIARLTSHAKAKGTTLSFDYTSEKKVNAPAWALEQILENLLSNAIKYSPGGSNVRLDFQNEDGSGHFHIADQGPGFSEADQKQLFKRYARLSALPTAGESSTGLGLSIVKRLVDQHGGNLRLLSGVGESACFRVSFPLVA